MGVLMSKSGKQADSVPLCLEHVIELDPLHPQANHNLAVYYYQLGNLDKARQVVYAMQNKGMEVGSDLTPLLNK